MKVVSIILVIVGVLILVGAAIGRFTGDQGLIVGFKVMNVVIVANTVLLSAVLVKLFEKKK